MSLKNEKVGVVVSDKMDKGVVVAVERKVRNDLYGKIQRRTSPFMAHDEENTAKVGDEVVDRRDAPAQQAQALGDDARGPQGGRGVARHVEMHGCRMHECTDGGR